MSIVVNNITSNNITSLENIVSHQSLQIKQLTDLYSDKNKRSFDQTTKQNITRISFNPSTQTYRFEIEKNENDMFMYQVWKKNSDLNSNRIYKYISLRSWISQFALNKKKSNFTPTTLIEINNIFYPTVMVDAVIENDFCVFYFDSRTINNIKQENSLQNLINTSYSNSNYSNVRFDIDDITNFDYLALSTLWGGYWYYYGVDSMSNPIVNVYYFESNTSSTTYTLYDMTMSKVYNGPISINQTNANNMSGTLLDKNSNVVNFNVTFTDYIIQNEQTNPSVLNGVGLTINGLTYNRCSPINFNEISNYSGQYWQGSINEWGGALSSVFITYPTFQIESGQSGNGNINPLISLVSNDNNLYMFSGFFPFIESGNSYNPNFMILGGSLLNCPQLYILLNRFYYNGNTQC